MIEAQPGVRTTRATLSALVDSYLDALRRHDPGSLDLSRLVKFTENGQELPPGEGLWATVDEVSPEPFSLVIDELSGTVVALTWVYEAEKPIVLSARIAVTDGRITELETVVSRGTNSPRTMTTVHPNALERRTMFDEVVPEERRVSREQLARAATLYLDSLERGEGWVVPVTDECVRYENGLKMTRNPTGEGFPPALLNLGGRAMTMTDVLGQGVAEQMDDSIISQVVQRVRDRRFAAIDEERGAVAIFFIFDHRQLETIAHPNCCYAGELFKIVDGKLTHIEAGFEIVPYGTQSGWAA